MVVISSYSVKGFRVNSLNKYKLLLGAFQLDTRGKFFTKRTISLLPREVLNSPTLDTLKIEVGGVLGHLV